MISIALSHPSAPASADHWAESLAWDRELAVREASAALGWSIAALEQRDDGTIELELHDADAHALLGLRGSVSLARSDRADWDVTLELRELGAGRYVVVGELPPRGLYQVTVDVQRGPSERFVVTRQLWLRGEPQVEAGS
jgi:nitrogen fixation protein FixH